jgi:cyd operon protein YbgE
VTTEPRPWLQRGYCRAVSLLLATPLTLIFLIHPAAMLTADGHYNHRLIMLSMLGISSGFIHGVGFDPISRLWKTLFHPVAGWLLMGLGYTILGQAQST